MNVSSRHRVARLGVGDRQGRARVSALRERVCAL